AVGHLSANSTITVAFPTGFGLPSNPSVTLGSGFAGCPSSIVGQKSGQAVTITLGTGCSLADSTQTTVKVAGVINPVADTYANTGFTVNTSSDTATVPSPSDISITAGIVTGASITGSPPPATAGATGATWAVGFTPTGVGTLHAHDT